LAEAVFRGNLFKSGTSRELLKLVHKLVHSLTHRLPGAAQGKLPKKMAQNTYWLSSRAKVPWECRSEIFATRYGP
jgi:hypothetical protein